MVNIAIVKLSAMGDIVHAMAALQFIKHALPDAHIDWIVEEGFVGLLENNPHIDTILPVRLKAIKKDRLQLFPEIRRIRSYAAKGYDIVIDAQGLIKSAVVSRMLGPNAGFDKDSIREKAAALFYRKSFAIPYEENVIYRNMELISSALDIEIDRQQVNAKKPFLFYDEKERRKSADFLDENQKNIIYILGSSWESKVYPSEQFVEVIKSLGENALLVWGDEKELSAAEYISGQCEAAVLPLLTLGELKALISKADLVIGGDSGPTHFAWAMNRPSITLFGPTPGERNSLVGEYTRVICSPSEVDPLRLNREDFSIGEINPAEIVQVAKELLERNFPTYQEEGR
jgi:heptosyltransferase-1